jgi:hypothetical protein
MSLPIQIKILLRHSGLEERQVRWKGPKVSHTIHQLAWMGGAFPFAWIGDIPKRIHIHPHPSLFAAVKE